MPDAIRVQPIPAMMSRMKHAKHGETPEGVDPRAAQWYWAMYDACPLGGDLDCRRRAARDLWEAHRPDLERGPTFDEYGALIYPRSRSSVQYEESLRSLR